MNISILTAAEVLRVCDPQSDLEKRLFDIAQELQQDLDIASQPVEPDYGDDDCDECDNKMSDIEVAIDLIESGKIDDALKKLQSIG